MTTEGQRRLRKSKDSERDLGRHLIEHDGPDPRLAPGGGIASSTGRVGHITALQYDVVSRTYAAENKHVVMPALLYKWWVQICQVARGQGKEPLLRWDMSNESRPRDVQPMVAITQQRHADLLAYERMFRDRTEPKGASAVRSYSKEDQVRRSPGRKRK